MYYRQENTEIFVQDLNENVTEDILFNEFSRFGAILSVAIKKHIVTHKSRGFGFVSYKNPKHGTLPFP
jgi:RNA recognition motif-containing protein